MYPRAPRPLAADQIPDAARAYAVPVADVFGSQEVDVNDKERYKQTYQAQLDEWSKEIARLRARADAARADARVEMHKKVDALDKNLQEAITTFAQLAQASDEAWGSVRKGAESAWASMKSSLNEAAAKFRE
jgi:uncharacterized coiled-coil DUF342 family protein